MPLTDTAIRTAKPTDKRQRLFDGGGLYLEISPKGGKWWRLKYRFAGKEKRLSLGVYPEISLKEARERRDKCRRQLANGLDPGAIRKAQKLAISVDAANSFEAVAREWYASKSQVWSPGYGSRTIKRLEQDIFPWIGNRPITSISAPDLLQVLRRIEKRGVHETAHRIMNICSQVFRYAVAIGVTERDITSDLRGALSPVKGTHFAAVTEPEKLAPILQGIDAYAGTAVVQAALKLTPMLFVRPGELRQAEWSQIDLISSKWQFMASKTKTPHIVPLCRQAVEILTELRPLTGKGRFVFPNPRSPKGDRPMSENAINTALRNMGIEKEAMSAHGFRATARTILDEVLGFPPHLLEHQLAHTVRDPLGRSYNRTSHLPERTIMMQKWADYLDTLKSAQGRQLGLTDS